MATRASRIALAGSNISSTGEVDADLLDNTDSAAFLSLDGSGRLGIGTSTLGTNNKLTLYHGDDTSYAALSLQSDHTSTGNANGSWLGIDQSSAMGLYVWNYESAPLRFGTSAVDRMHITAAGSVGIGTTAPLTLLMTEQTGGNLTSGNAIKSSTMKGLTLNAQEGAAHTNSLGVWFGSNGAHWSGIAGGRSATGTWATDLRFYTHEANAADLTYSRQRMVINSEGNILVGTTSAGYPAYGDKLTIANTGHAGMTIRSGTGSQGTIYFSDAVGTATGTYSGAIIYQHDTDKLALRAGASDRITILGTGSGAGNVGIATGSPGEKLSVNGTVSGSSYRVGSGATISAERAQNTKLKGPSGTDGGLVLLNSSNAFQFQLYGNSSESAYGFLNGTWGSWDLRKQTAAGGGNLYMNNSTTYYLNANGTSKTYKHLIGGVSNTAGGAAFKVGSADNNGELSLHSVVGGSTITSYNRTSAAYHPLTTYASQFKVNSGSAQMFEIDGYGHIKTQYGSTSGYAQTSGNGGIAIVNDTGSVGCALISVVNATRGWSNFYVNRIHTSGQDTRFMQFVVNGSGACGYVQLASASSMTYGTSSDYRLKENVVYEWDATTRLKQLKPARFNFILDGTDTTQDGFMAHEVSDIVPLAVQGTKDAMKDEEYEVTPAVRNSDGVETTPAVMATRSVIDGQGIDHSYLVPLLVKTVQELEARLTAAGI